MGRICRREFLRISAIASAGTLAAACVAPSAPVTEPIAAPLAEEPTVAPEAPEVVPMYSEAPMLAELVEAGELPPVEERLPENPLVCPVLESIGKYGGTWRSAFKGMADVPAATTVKERGPLTIERNITVQPDICEGWELNEDATVWTFHMRKGMKWSDGHPFTAADVQWYWDNVVNNKELTPGTHSHWSTESEGKRTLARLEVPDDFTFAFTFVEPRVMFDLDMLWRRTPWVPAHYLQQFHADFAPEEQLDAKIEELGVATWADLFSNRNTNYMNPERPSLDVWLPKNTASSQLLELERNPYFHQIDPEGQQLPYIDRVTYRFYETADVFLMWMINGQIDMPGRTNTVDFTDYTVYKEHEAEGYYVILPEFGLSHGHEGFQINQAPKNNRLRPIFQDRRFRIAVSLAMNREEMNELIYDGMATPRQFSPIETSPQYYPKLSNAYIEYDPDEANRLLDEMGMTERDGEGFRLFPDGSGDTFSFIIEGPRQPGTPAEDLALMAVQYLADVGLKASYKYSERSLFETRVNANETEVGYWGCDLSILPVHDARQFTGVQLQRNWPGGWGIWKNDPTDPNAEEPPEDHWIREIWRIYWDEVLLEPDEQERYRLFEKILDIHAEELPTVHFLGQFPLVGVKPAKMHNVSTPLTLYMELGYTHTLYAQQYYWEDPENH